MYLWLWLYIANKLIGATCPFTYKFGALLNILSMVASYVFIILAFIFAPHWWYGLILIGVTIAIPLFMPKINPDDCGTVMLIYSGIFSHLSPILVILMYLSFFGVI